MINNWPLVTDMVKAAKLTPPETAQALVDSFVDAILNKLDTSKVKNEELLSIDDYSEKFIEFTKICENPSLIGEKLFNYAKNEISSNSISTKISVKSIINILLHASLCIADVDECAELLESLVGAITAEKNQVDIIIQILSVFPDPALLPRYFQFIIAQHKLNALPHAQLSTDVGRVIMNCARHVHPFEPQKYFELTLNYQLYRDHAELQMECGNKLLEGNPDKKQLVEAFGVLAQRLRKGGAALHRFRRPPQHDAHRR